jgi:predicted aspartyl protease/Flp pilus assembly protein TadD
MRMLSSRAFFLGCCVLLLGGSAVLVSSDETSPEAYLELADRQFLETRYRDSADNYRRARDHEAIKVTPGLLRRAAAGLTRSLLRQTRFADARTEAARYLESHPLDSDSLTLDGETLWGVGLFPEAQQRFTDAIARDANDTYAYHGLARALAAQRQFEPALVKVDEAIRRTPREIEPRFTRAFILERLHRFDEAAAALREAMTLFLPNEKSDRVLLTRSQIKFLEAFRGRTPFEIADDIAEKTFTVPFRVERDKIIVKGRFNGGNPIDLVLDTGAEMTVVARRTAERTGVTPTGYTISAGVGERGVRGLMVGRLDQLQIGQFKIRHVPALIKSPALIGIPRVEADSFSPLSLGMSMTLDYTKKQLTFGRHVEPRGEIELPLYSYRLVMVRGTINDRTPASFVVDTGGEVISISSSMAAMLDKPRARRIPLKVWGSSGWDRDAELWPGLALAFDRIRFENFSTVVLNLRAPSALLGFELGGIVGHRFLSKYHVGVDLKRNRLTLTPIVPGSASKVRMADASLDAGTIMPWEPRSASASLPGASDAGR